MSIWSLPKSIKRGDLLKWLYCWFQQCCSESSQESWRSYLRAGSRSYLPAVLQALCSCSELRSLVHQGREEGISGNNEESPGAPVRCSRCTQATRAAEGKKKEKTVYTKENSAVGNVLAKGSAYLTRLSIGTTKLKLIYSWSEHGEGLKNTGTQYVRS